MSCLFNSFEACLKLYSISDSSNTMRQKICDYLLTNPILMDDINAETIISWDSNLSLKDYVQRMRLTSTWGGALEIRCFVNLYDFDVEVVNIRNLNLQNITLKQIIEFVKPNTKGKIRITWSGNHYEPLGISI